MELQAAHRRAAGAHAATGARGLGPGGADALRVAASIAAAAICSGVADGAIGAATQPGLAGLMDGSVSTLAPIFATAFATQDTWTTFLVGAAASVGAAAPPCGCAAGTTGRGIAAGARA